MNLIRGLRVACSSQPFCVLRFLVSFRFFFSPIGSLMDQQGRRHYETPTGTEGRGFPQEREQSAAKCVLLPICSSTWKSLIERKPHGSRSDSLLSIDRLYTVSRRWPTGRETSRSLLNRWARMERSTSIYLVYSNRLSILLHFTRHPRLVCKPKSTI